MSAPPAPPAEPQTLGGCLLAAVVGIAVLGGLGVAASHGLFWHALVAFVAISLWIAHREKHGW